MEKNQVLIWGWGWRVKWHLYFQWQYVIAVRAKFPSSFPCFSVKWLDMRILHSNIKALKDETRMCVLLGLYHLHAFVMINSTDALFIVKCTLHLLEETIYRAVYKILLYWYKIGALSLNIKTNYKLIRWHLSDTPFPL